MATKKKFEWKILLKKFGFNLLYAIVAGFIILWQDDARFVVVLPILKAAENYIKHNWL